MFYLSTSVFLSCKNEIIVRHTYVHFRTLINFSFRCCKSVVRCMWKKLEGQSLWRNSLNKCQWKWRKINFLFFCINKYDYTHRWQKSILLHFLCKSQFFCIGMIIKICGKLQCFLIYKGVYLQKCFVKSKCKCRKKSKTCFPFLLSLNYFVCVGVVHL